MNDTADTEQVAQPTSEETNVEGNSLDQVLSEYDQATAPAVPETGTTTEPQTNDNDLVVQYVKQKMFEDANKSVNEAVSEAVSTMKETANLQIPDKALVGYLNVLADEDPRFRQAFLNRETAPAVWQAAVKAAGKELASPPIDSNTTEDMSAVSEALTRGSKSKSATSTDAAPTQKDLNKMSDAEFYAWERANMN